MENLKGMAFAVKETAKVERAKSVQKQVYQRPAIEVYEVDAEPFLAGTGKVNAPKNIIQNSRNTIQAEQQGASDAYDYSKGSKTDDQSWNY